MEKNTQLKRSWYEFYKNKCNEQYYQYICSKYYRFIYEIFEHLKDNMSIGEFGCGIGNITKMLIKYNPYSFHNLIDSSSSILDLANNHLRNTNGRYDLTQWDILEPYKIKFDLIHSHGVLEHFSNQDITKIINNQLAISPLLIHYVPSDKYDYKSFGDERLLPKEYWRREFKPTEIIEFNNGYDLILKWRKNNEKI